MQVALGLVASTEPIRKSDNGVVFEMSYVFLYFWSYIQLPVERGESHMKEEIISLGSSLFKDGYQ